MRTAAIVLAGGQSSRMGVPKAELPFGPESMLQRILGILEPIVSCRIVVSAANSNRSMDIPDVVLTQDFRSDRGPLEGIRAGLMAAGAEGVEAAFVTSCDVPLLRTTFVQKLFALLGDQEIVVPWDDQFHHPLSAVYRVGLVDRIEDLLSQERLRPLFLIQESDSREVSVEDFRDVDPQLDSLRNCNRPLDYQAALQSAGIEMDSLIRQRLQLE